MLAQDYDDEETNPPPQGPGPLRRRLPHLHTFVSRTKEYPRVKNASARYYAFKSTASVLNTLLNIGFQHNEILVSTSGAVITDGTDFPAHVGNGTTLVGFPQTDVMNAIDTAGGLSQIRMEIKMTGTQFGVKPPGTSMPRTIKLQNYGFKCPAPTRKGKNTTSICDEQRRNLS